MHSMYSVVAYFHLINMHIRLLIAAWSILDIVTAFRPHYNIKSHSLRTLIGDTHSRFQPQLLRVVLAR